MGGESGKKPLSEVPILHSLKQFSSQQHLRLFEESFTESGNLSLSPVQSHVTRRSVSDAGGSRTARKRQISTVDAENSHADECGSNSDRSPSPQALQRNKRHRKGVTGHGTPKTETALRMFPSPVERRDQHSSITGIIDAYGRLSSGHQAAFLWDFLRTTNLPALQVVSTLITPTLRKDYLACLPREVSHIILSHLDLPSIGHCASVSKTWREVVDHDVILWRRLILDNGWEDRMIRDITILRKAKSRLADIHVEQDLLSNSVKEEHELPPSPIHFPNLECVFQDPFLLFPTLKAPPKTTKLRSSHVYKLMFSHYFILRRNWFLGKSRNISYQAHNDNVITNLYIDANRIISCSDDQIINIFDIKTGALKQELDGHEGGVWCLNVCGPQMNTLVSGSTDRTIRVWDIARGKCLLNLRGHQSTVRSLLVLPQNPSTKQDSYPTVVSGARDSVIRVWKIRYAPAIDDIQEDNEPINSIASDIITDGSDTRTSTLRTVVESPSASATEDMDRAETLNEPNREEDGESDFDDDEHDDDEIPVGLSENVSDEFLYSLMGHTNSVRVMAAHGDILVSGSYDFHIRVWNLPSRRCLFTLVGHTNKVYSLVYDWKADRVISGSMDNTIRIWCLKTGTCTNVLYGHSGLVGLIQLEYLSFVPSTHVHPLGDDNDQKQASELMKRYSNSSTGRMSVPVLVSAAADGLLKVWDPSVSKPLYTLYGHQHAITCFTFDNDKLISGGEGSVKIWDLRTGMVVRDLVTDITGAWKLCMNERYCVAAVSRDGLTWFEVMDFAVSY